MNLNQVVKKFATVPIDAWDGVTWDTAAIYGSMEVYSRFITERTFGVVKRLLMLPEAIPDRYKVLRMPDGSEHLIANESKDYRGPQTTPYAFTYLIQSVIGQARVVTLSTTPAASGMASSDTEVFGDYLPCYFERFGATDSSQVDAVTYSRTKILLPKGTVLSVDDEIEIGVERYSIRETDFELNLTRAMGVEK